MLTNRDFLLLLHAFLSSTPSILNGLPLFKQLHSPHTHTSLVLIVSANFARTLPPSRLSTNNLAPNSCCNHVRKRPLHFSSRALGSFLLFSLLRRSTPPASVLFVKAQLLSVGLTGGKSPLLWRCRPARTKRRVYAVQRWQIERRRWVNPGAVGDLWRVVETWKVLGSDVFFS